MARKFDGSTSIANLTLGSALSTGDWTIAAWVLPTGTGGGANGSVFMTTGFVQGMSFDSTSGGFQALQTFATTNAQSKTFDVVLNQWQLVAAVYTSFDQTVRMFRGTLTQPMAEVTYLTKILGVGTRTAGVTGAAIGSVPGFARSWAGSLSSVLVAGRVISVVELEGFRLGVPLPADRGFWPLDGSTPAQVSDLLAQTNTGTVTALSVVEDPPVPLGWAEYAPAPAAVSFGYQFGVRRYGVSQPYTGLPVVTDAGTRAWLQKPSLMSSARAGSVHAEAQMPVLAHPDTRTWLQKPSLLPRARSASVFDATGLPTRQVTKLVTKSLGSTSAAVRFSTPATSMLKTIFVTGSATVSFATGSPHLGFLVHPNAASVSFGSAAANLRNNWDLGHGSAAVHFSSSPALLKQRLALTGSAAVRLATSPVFLGQRLAVVGSAAVRLATGGASYHDVVLLDGPLSYWRLDDAGTTALDQQGLNDGTLHGGITEGVGGAITGTNKAMTFNGSTGYISLAQLSAYQTAHFSLEAWFKTTSGAGQQVIYRWRFYANILCLNSGRPAVSFNDSAAAAYTAQSATAYNDGLWHHLVGTYDGSAVKLYVDGNLDTSTPATAAIFYFAGGASIGRDGDFSGSYFNGGIDEVAVYDHALTASQVQAHYLAGTSSVAGARLDQRLAVTGTAAITVATRPGQLLQRPINRPPDPGPPPPPPPPGRAPVRKWTFWDPITAETVAFQINPHDGAAPERERQLTYQGLTANTTWDGGVSRSVVFEGAEKVVPFNFSGTLLGPEDYEMFVTWYRKRHAVVLTDDFGRDFVVYIKAFRPKRVMSRQVFWRHTYDVECDVVSDEVSIPPSSPPPPSGTTDQPTPPPPAPAPQPSNCIMSPASSTVGATGTYSDIFWPNAGAGDYFNLDVTMTPERDPDTPAGHGYFYSHQFAIDGSGGNNGYLGIQWGSNRTDGTVGKIALFSIWGALDAQGGDTHGPFGGEGTGYHCAIDYDWVAGTSYRLRIWSLGLDSSGNKWWGAWIRDESSQVERQIGQILVPAGWGNLSTASIVWTEHFYGDTSTCGDLPYSSCRFQEFKGNGAAYQASSFNNHFGSAACPSRICLVGSGVRQEVGVPA